MKMNFDYFQIQKRMLQTVRMENVYKEMGSFVYFPCFLLELSSLGKWYGLKQSEHNKQ